MSRRNPSPDPATVAAQSRCAVTVCRGCCCGTAKIPGINHAAQLDRLRRTATTTQVRTSDCLDACEYANVIVVQPSPEGRRAGGRPVWLGLANDPDLTDDIAAWLADGGPGLAEPPEILSLHVITPSRRVRQQLT